MKSYLLSLVFLFSFICSLAQNNINIDLLYQWKDTTLVPTSAYNNTYNEVWGFVQDGREYAVIGSTAGTHIFDITNPLALPLTPIFVPGSSQGPHLVHRDYHDYEGYLYIVADEGSSSTLKVLDLSFLPDSVSIVYNSDSLFTTAHNIFIDSATARMYACGPNSTNVEIISLTDPENPVLLLHYDGVGYVHDVYARNDTAFLNAGGNGLHIVDFTDIGNPQTLGSLTQYPYKGYNHSGWISEDGDSYFFADENHGYKMKSIDISDYGNIGVVDTFFSDVDPMSMPHNLIVKDNYLYVSHYHDGLQIFDVSDPANVFVAGSYDTYPLSDHDSYRGAWGVYPFLPSGNILVSDMQTGLYVLGVSISWDCVNNSCVDPGTGNGAYSTLTDCQAACGSVSALWDVTMNLNSKVKLKLFPNPSSGDVNLVIPENCSSDFELSVYDVYGKLLFSEMILDYSSNSIRLNLEDYHPGVYLIECSSEDGKWNSRIIKK